MGHSRQESSACERLGSLTRKPSPHAVAAPAIARQLLNTNKCSSAINMWTTPVSDSKFCPNKSSGIITYGNVSTDAKELSVRDFVKDMEKGW